MLEFVIDMVGEFCGDVFMEFFGYVFVFVYRRLFPHRAESPKAEKIAHVAGAVLSVVFFALLICGALLLADGRESILGAVFISISVFYFLVLLCFAFVLYFKGKREKKFH